jgi:predicted dehydrogenase
MRYAAQATGGGREGNDADGHERAHGSYEGLINDPDIEVVCNPLPNSLHVPFTPPAAAAGKHVLCEKPIALSAAAVAGSPWSDATPGNHQRHGEVRTS